GGKDNEIANKLLANNIATYAIHIAPGSPPPQLLTITNRTGGEVFAAGDPLALKAIFNKIDQMQKTQIERVGAESMDFFKPFALIGTAITTIFLLSLFGLRYTPW
ncbi:MAG: aerotolerance regulator BatA, partial [Verrucomicrobiales bacterium]